MPPSDDTREDRKSKPRGVRIGVSDTFRWKRKGIEKLFTGADGMTHCDLYSLQITKHQQVVNI